MVEMLFTFEKEAWRGCNIMYNFDDVNQNTKHSLLSSSGVMIQLFSAIVVVSFIILLWALLTRSPILK